MGRLNVKHRLPTSGVDLATLEECPLPWLVSVDNINNITELSYDHAWIDGEQRVYILNYEGDALIRIDNNDVWESIEQIKQVIQEIKEHLARVDSDIYELQERYDQFVIELRRIDDEFINIRLDMDNKANKVVLAEEGNVTTLDEDGQYQDSGHSLEGILHAIEAAYNKSYISTGIARRTSGDVFSLSIPPLGTTRAEMDGSLIIAYFENSTNGGSTGELSEIVVNGISYSARAEFRDIPGTTVGAGNRPLINDILEKRVLVFLDNVNYAGGLTSRARVISLDSMDGESIIKNDRGLWQIDEDWIASKFQRKSPTDNILYGLKNGDLEEIDIEGGGTVTSNGTKIAAVIARRSHDNAFTVTVDNFGTTRHEMNGNLAILYFENTTGAVCSGELEQLIINDIAFATTDGFKDIPGTETIIGNRPLMCDMLEKRALVFIDDVNYVDQDPRARVFLLDSITDGGVIGDIIASNVVTTSGSNVQAELDTINGNNWVTTVRIADNAVRTDQIGTLAVTTGRIANNAVTSAKLAGSSVMPQHLHQVTNDVITESVLDNVADRYDDRMKLPVELDRESQLPENLQEGDFFIVASMDETSMGGSGKIWVSRANGELVINRRYDPIIYPYQPKSSCMIYREDFVLVNAHTPVPFNKEFAIGNKFMLSNGEIKILEDVNVMISAYVYKSQGGMEAKIFYLQKRQVDILGPLRLVSYKEMQNGEAICSIPQFMTNLKAGESIYVSCNESFHLHGQQGTVIGDGIMSYLSVQEI